VSGGQPAFVRWFEDLGEDDVPTVGGKNASLGEMIASLGDRGIRVPGGFATTAAAYRSLLRENDLRDPMRKLLEKLEEDEESLPEVGRSVRRLLRRAEFPGRLEEEVRSAYRELSDRYDTKNADVAVRSSATAEDLPTASFAGQQETVLNVVGEEDLLDACRECFASLFTDRAISYRRSRDFDHLQVALSVGVQKMVRSDLAGAGVMFTIDTETGFPRVVVINAAWGLGETVVQGSVNPDEYQVFKPLLEREGLRPIVGKSLGDKANKVIYSSKGGTSPTKTVQTSQKERAAFVLDDDEILRLARWGMIIEDHYGRPMDIEWAKDGRTGEIFIVQARPETVQSQKEAGALRTFRLTERGDRLVEGLSIGDGVAAGEIVIAERPDETDRFREGAVLVTGLTDPDWVPLMERASAIVTDHGGRTSHAAIVSRELGIPAVVGTGDATRSLAEGSPVTVSCAEGETGYVYDGVLEFETSEVDLSNLPETETAIMMIVATPAAAFHWWRLPVAGIGLARMEFIIGNEIRIHPSALVNYDTLEDEEARRAVERLTAGYDDKREYFVEHLARGIARIAASQYPQPVILRLSDLKSNEYADLIGGRAFEQPEANPMLGFRGAARYLSPRYREAFGLECRAIERVRGEMGLNNVVVMVPFCRTLDEADRVVEMLEEHGLRRGEDGLQVYVMCEVPSNVVLADEFAERFDGFSIGSNDLTQLILGVDRDSEELAELFDERDPAVVRSIRLVIERAHRAGRPIGICGQAPSDHPGFAATLVEAGIDSISLNPDRVVDVLRTVAEHEQAGR